MCIPGVNALKWVGDRYFFQESPIAFGTDQDASACYTAGWLWVAAIAGRYTPVDSLAVDSSGQQWFEYSTEQSGAGLWLAVPLTATWCSQHDRQIPPSCRRWSAAVEGG